MLLVVAANLMSRSRIGTVAGKLKIPYECVSGGNLAEGFRDGVDTVVVDLSSFDFGELDAGIKGEMTRRRTRLIGFYPHTQAHLKEKAKAAGFGEVYTNGDFFGRTSEILSNIS